MNFKTLLIGLFIPVTLLTSCSNDEEQKRLQALEEREQALREKEAATKLEIEKIKLEEENKRLETERLAIEEEKRREKMASIERLERMFPDYTNAIVAINKTYFHSSPQESTASKKKFLVSGDYIQVIKTRNGYGYVEYYNANVDKTTSGWLDLNDLEPQGMD
jgi:hypothetical protein